MAELPISSKDLPDAPAVRIPGSDFIRGASRMPMVRQAGLLFAIAGAVALAVVSVLWMQDEDLKPLTNVHNAEQAAELVQLLEASGITYRMDHKTGTMLVDAQRLYEARMTVSSAGATQQGQLGYELLDQEQSFGVSQFMENARHRRSVEGELARSIGTIKAVQHARVLLAVPKSTTFLRDRRKPSASVTVTLRPGQSLSPDQVRGITNLVAGAVSELDTQDVAVVDQSGRLLSRQEEDPGLEASERQLRYVAKLENQLRTKVEVILERMLGSDAYTTQVTAEVDFTKQEQATEQYAPQETAVRSESTLEEERLGAVPAIGVPGTLANQPPPEPVPGPAGAAEGQQQLPRTVRNEATRNYEVDRTVSYSQQSVGRLSRLAVSVVVDHHRSVNAETGEVEAAPWTQEELQQLEATVANAIGFSAARGDSISVVSSPFRQLEFETPEPAPFWTETWFIDLVKQVLGGMVLVLVLFLLLRPLYRSLSRAGEMVHERQAMEIADMNQAREQQLAHENALGLPSPEQGHAASPFAKLDAVKGLVANDPARVAEVVKHWVNQGE